MTLPAQILAQLHVVARCLIQVNWSALILMESVEDFLITGIEGMTRNQPASAHP
jgi:hypothetical protein